MASEVPVSAPVRYRAAAWKTDADLLSIADRAAWSVLRIVSSLKVTVVLFGMGIFIILVGTLAQVDKDMWQVIDEYFRSWIAVIDFQVFFPRSWAPNYQNIPYGFWFPGGATIGAAMVVNLLAAHLVRFKTQATRGRIIAGTLVLLAGAALTAHVISSGHNLEGLQGQPPFSWQTLWLAVKGLLACASVAMFYAAFAIRAKDSSRTVEFAMLGAGGLLLGLITLWTLLAQENAYLGDSGMRILWQLIQATLCGLVLLLGCWLAFRKRGGIVLIHIGVGLMMFGQFYVSKYDVEEQMRIEEGQTRAYAEDIRQTELAIVDSSHPSKDEVVVVPQSTLLASSNYSASSLFTRQPSEVDKQGIIRHPDLPFDIQVIEYYKNSDVRDAKADEKNIATSGAGRQLIAELKKPSSGADSEGRVDLASAYVRFIDKDDSRDIGTYLLSQLTLDEQVPAGDKTYNMSLRFQRNYKPYQITLLDVRKDDYVGTSTPRNYSSDVHLVDKSRDVDREIHIWMNNPLRYAGETFYQSGYVGPPDTEIEATTLSVVTNSGWMIPYVSCMIVIVGLGAHFLGTLSRFLRRSDAGDTLLKMSRYGVGIGLVGLLISLLHKSGQRSRIEKKTLTSKKRGAAPSKSSETSGQVFEPSLEPITLGQTVGALFPLIVLAPLVLWLIASMWPDNPSEQEMNLREFGRLPVIAEGRVKPFDTLARNSLRAISNRETFRDSNDKRQPAIRWLLDVITTPQRAEQHRVMRIDNLEVLDTLGLKRRKSHLYSIAEIRGGVEAFEKQVDQAQRAAKQAPEKLSIFQRKLLELDRRIHIYTRVAAAFEPPSLPPLPTREEFEQNRAVAEQQLIEFRDAYVRFVRSLDGIQPPLAVPVKSSDDGVHQKSEEWEPYAKAWATALIDGKLLGNSPPPALRALNEILVAYSDGDVQKFNEGVSQYHQLLRRERPSQLVAANTFWNRMVERTFGNFYRFEELFNHVAPFFFCWFPYVFAAVLAALSWLVWKGPLVRSAWWLAGFGFLVHTVALGARIYISGRPPVTNLYSSAVFIGWGVVLLCLLWEWLYRNGLATFVGSLLGFASLIIAHVLAADGDTFTVLQAVLDTQFWLATHVVCVTLGYATTFLAGSIGIAYVLRGLFTPTLTAAASNEMARMIYGTTCFALFFSFFGTVLGGLWADDSWGRFWGWDPKENGALIIVLWNALVLHAHWDGMAKDRGLAVLAVVGNMVTSWSWFGVNELGVGLHSYGFTEGVLFSLMIFAVSQILVVVAGSIPKSLWWSFSVHGKPRPDKVLTAEIA